ncbi:MAG: ATP-binding protein [Thiolinea sp.]
MAERLGGTVERFEETPPSTQEENPTPALPLSREGAKDASNNSPDKGRLGGVSSTLFILKLPNNFPLNVNRVLLYFPSTPAEDTLNALRAIPQAEGRITLIIGADGAYQRKLLNTSQDRSNKYVAPQSKQITELLLSPNPEPVFAKILAEQLALQQLSPYQIGGGVNKEAIFFGRRELIAQIINRDPANYLIVGGRQMGKSSLLKALERRYAENTQVRVYYQTLSNETLIPRLAAALDLPETESAQTFAQALEAQLKAEGKRYIFLIDEADLFIAHEQAQGYPILSVFRRLSEQGQCSFILAGFWQLYQHAVLDYQSPLRNFGEVLEVAALEQDACEQLATQPMQTLSLSYANPSLVANMIVQCGQRANLIAYVCHQVIQQLDASQRVIEAGDIHRVLEGRDLQKRLAGWSVGIGEQEQAYDRLVVYSTIQKDSFTVGELMQELEQQGVRFDSAELERALSRLELAFVLKKTQSRYSYCVPLFVDYMREDEAEVRRISELKMWS